MARESTYDIGDLVRVTALFEDAAGDPINPGARTLLVLKPDGTTVDMSGSVQTDGTGSYYADVDVTLAGRWVYRWEGTAPAQAAAEHGFLVREQQVTAP